MHVFGGLREHVGRPLAVQSRDRGGFSDEQRTCVVQGAFLDQDVRAQMLDLASKSLVLAQLEGRFEQFLTPAG